jgi:hypothetical protein
MDRANAEAVVAKWFEGQRADGGFLFGNIVATCCFVVP